MEENNNTQTQIVQQRKCNICKILYVVTVMVEKITHEHKLCSKQKNYGTYAGLASLPSG